MNVSELGVAITGDITDLAKTADDGKKVISGMVEGMKLSLQATSAPFALVKNGLGAIVDGLGKVGLAASGLSAIGNSAVSMINGLTAGNAALEMTTISFKTLLGSAGAADAMIKQLTQFAATTPFNLTGLEASTQKLLAFGYTSDQIIPLMTSLGDAIAALGGTQDNLNSLVYVMGQMHQEAHINAGDIMQMVNQGIPALQMLADHYHVTTGQIQEMISKGLIPGADAVNILSAAMEKQYGGMMAAQSSTFSGMVSNLQDWATQTTNTLTKPFFEPAKKALAAFLAYVQSPAGVAAVNKLAGYIQEGVDRMTAAFVKFEPYIKPSLEKLLNVAEALRSQFTPGIITLIPLIEKLIVRFEPLAVSAFKFYQAIQPMNIAFAVLKGLLTGGVTGALDELKTRFEFISGYVKTGLDFALVEARKFGPALLNWVLDTAIMLAGKVVVWGEALIQWVAPYAVRLVNELISLGGRVLNWAVGYAPVLANQVLIWAETIAGWVIPAIPKVLNALLQLGLGVVGWVEREAPMLTSMFITWAGAALSWILPAIPGIISTLAQIGISVLSFVEREAPILLNAFLGWTAILASWILPAIPGVISALTQLGATVVNWAITTLPGLLGQVIVGIGAGFGVNLRGPVNDVLMIFNSLVENIRATVIPAFMEMMGFIGTNVVPLFNEFSSFLATSIIPLLADLAAFIMTVGVPAFTRIAEVVGLVLGPSLRLISSVVQNELLPTLTGMWQTFDSKYMPTIRNLASEFGEHLAGGIGSVISRLKDSAPAIDGFIAKAAPIAEKVIGIATAFSPLVTIFDVFKGFLTGGVEGGVFALEQRIAALGKVFGLDLGPAMQGFDTFVGDTLIPTIKNIVTWVETSLIPAVVSFAKTFINDVIPGIISFGVSVYNTVKPAVDAIVKFILENLIPAIKSMAEWFELHIVPIIQAVAKTFMQDVLPALGRFWDFATKNIFPALGDLFDWISDKIIPVIGKLVSFILDTVVPVLVNWWEVLATVLKPIIEWLADFIVNTLIPAMTNIGKFLISDVFPVLKNMVNIFVNDVLPVLGTVVNIFGTVLGAAINIPIAGFNILKTIIGTVAGVISAFVGGEISVLITVFQTLGSVIGTVVGGAIGGLMWGVNNIILPGFNLMTSVIGNIIDFIKTAVRTMANFFVDVINTPLNMINGILDGLRNISILGAQPFNWLPHLPTLGYLSFANGTPPWGAPGGMAMVGDNPYGPELVETGGQKYLVSAPTLTMLNKGDKVTPVSSGKGGGDTYQITIPLTIYGNPDDLAVAQFEDMATRIVENALANTGAGTSSRINFSGAQR